MNIENENLGDWVALRESKLEIKYFILNEYPKTTLIIWEV